MAKQSAAVKNASTGATKPEANILRTQEEVLACESSRDLIATYFALGGQAKNPDTFKFTNLETGRRRVVALIMAAQEANNHSGVAPNVNTAQEPAPTVEELEEKGRAKDEPIEVPVQTEDGVTANVVKFPDGTMA